MYSDHLSALGVEKYIVTPYLNGRLNHILWPLFLTVGWNIYCDPSSALRVDLKHILLPLVRTLGWNDYCDPSSDLWVETYIVKPHLNCGLKQNVTPHLNCVLKHILWHLIWTMGWNIMTRHLNCRLKHILWPLILTATWNILWPLIWIASMRQSRIGVITCVTGNKKKTSINMKYSVLPRTLCYIWSNSYQSWELMLTCFKNSYLYYKCHSFYRSQGRSVGKAHWPADLVVPVHDPLEAGIFSTISWHSCSPWGVAVPFETFV